MYKLRPTAKFKKDIRQLKKRGYNMSLLADVVKKLSKGEVLPEQCCDHPLKGNRQGYRDCHIQNDWILIYKIEEDVLVLTLSETGTHSDLF